MGGVSFVRVPKKARPSARSRWQEGGGRKKRRTDGEPGEFEGGPTGVAWDDPDTPV